MDTDSTALFNTSDDDLSDDISFDLHQYIATHDILDNHDWREIREHMMNMQDIECSPDFQLDLIQMAIQSPNDDSIWIATELALHFATVPQSFLETMLTFFNPQASESMLASIAPVFMKFQPFEYQAQLISSIVDLFPVVESTSIVYPTLLRLLAQAVPHSDPLFEPLVAISMGAIQSDDQTHTVLGLHLLNALAVLRPSFGFPDPVLKPVLACAQSAMSDTVKATMRFLTNYARQHGDQLHRLQMGWVVAAMPLRDHPYVETLTLGLYAAAANSSPDICNIALGLPVVQSLRPYQYRGKEHILELLYVASQHGVLRVVDEPERETFVCDFFDSDNFESVIMALQICIREQHVPLDCIEQLEKLAASDNQNVSELSQFILHHHADNS